MSSVLNEKNKMKIKSKKCENKIYKNLDRGLNFASKNFLVCCKKQELHKTRVVIEQIIRKLVEVMIKISPTFLKFKPKIFGVGSAYDETKIGNPNEFDIDIVLKLPDGIQPVLKNEFMGFTQIYLENFISLSKTDPEMFRTFHEFVDEENYLLSEEMMLLYIRKILNQAKDKYFPDGVITVRGTKYTITKIEYIEPALTLTLEGLNFLVTVDLVASFALSENLWPSSNYRQNPYPSNHHIFLVPSKPLESHFQKRRFWRLSFHIQEKQIVFNRFKFKPALRILKRIRDHFKQAVHSYALKTIFLWELQDSLALNSETSYFWKSSLSYIVIHMLEKYLNCLKSGEIPYFWNSNLNLISYLPRQEIEKYEKQIEGVLIDLKNNFDTDFITKYLK